jgi:hypothetical protein
MTFAPEAVHVSIGKAVLAVQYFEHWLNNAYYHMRIATEDGFQLTDEQLSDHRLFRNPVKNLVKALSAGSKINPALESRISTLLEQRHIIMHRWFLLHGAPTAHDSAKWAKLSDLSDAVAAEALELSYLLLGHLGEALRQMTNGEDPAKTREHMERLFTHLGCAPNNSSKPNGLCPPA